ncbi:hypothetical protein UFOVP450_59 [uncultured Caudovirales phage]|uniref:Uncharacterized protein n=1 Tax=uncultured Caudovirales phage TaxID=2100421 RepID=A0A6J5MDC5_9CAUD|nr:hypothetical protein UFOVP450_59 [uncultured Caudovirales phage]
MAPGDTAQDAINEANLLGEASFTNFWGGAALQVLMGIVEAEPEVLEILKIVNERGKTLTIAEFLEEIQPLKIIMR